MTDGEGYPVDLVIAVQKASHATAEGTATFKGETLEWMAYRETANSVRVMLSRDSKWIPREQPHGLRRLIRPVALQVMAIAKKTKSGQAIHGDHVIQEIYKGLVGSEEGE